MHQRTTPNLANTGPRAGDAFERLIVSSSGGYNRQRHLPRVLPVGPVEIGDRSAEGHRTIISRLTRALRAERNRGRAGHWTYDLNRHIALYQAYTAERRLLREKPPS